MKDAFAFFRFPQIKAGPAKVARIDLRKYGEIGGPKPIIIPFQSGVYFVEADGEGLDVVYLRKGKQRTLLQGVSIGECVGWFVIWAGDLDGDGKLDLVVVDEALTTYLFLSSSALPGHLVRKAAVLFQDGDC